MTRFYASNKRPETRIFLLKLDEFQIAWWRYPGREEGVGKHLQSLRAIGLLAIIKRNVVSTCVSKTSPRSYGCHAVTLDTL